MFFPLLLDHSKGRHLFRSPSLQWVWRSSARSAGAHHVGYCGHQELGITPLKKKTTFNFLASLFVTFLGWLSDPVKGQVTSNYRIERSVGIAWYLFIYIFGIVPLPGNSGRWKFIWNPLLCRGLIAFLIVSTIGVLGSRVVLQPIYQWSMDCDVLWALGMTRWGHFIFHGATSVCFLNVIACLYDHHMWLVSMVTPWMNKLQVFYVILWSRTFVFTGFNLNPSLGPQQPMENMKVYTFQYMGYKQNP